MGSLCSRYSEELPCKKEDFLESKMINTSNFKFEKVIGKGSFGRVMLVTKKDTGKQYAMKVVNKGKLIDHKKRHHTLTERYCLAELNSPFVVKLHYAFQTSDKLYFALDFMQGGELFYHLKKQSRFTEETAKFYAAEVLLGLEDVHSQGYIYRDLKPENILLDKEGHVKLADFNLATKPEDEINKKTVCGTPEYISPEVLNGKEQNLQLDYWGLGILLYEMLEGKSPFYSKSIDKLFRNISKAKYSVPDRFSPSAKDLVVKLLDPCPETRLSNSEQIKLHPFFKGINWDLLRSKLLTAPIKVVVSFERDLRNFNYNHKEDFTPAPDWETPEKLANVYDNFTYAASLAK